MSSVDIITRHSINPSTRDCYHDIKSKTTVKARATCKKKLFLRKPRKKQVKAKEAQAPPRPNSTFSYWYETKPIISCNCWVCALWPGKTKFIEKARYHLVSFDGVVAT